MKAKEFRRLKLSSVERKVLRLIQGKQVKNIERPIKIGRQKALDPRGKPLTASYLNISNQEAAQFRKLERKGLITVPRGKPEYYINFRVTPKGKAQIKVKVIKRK